MIAPWFVYIQGSLETEIVVAILWLQWYHTYRNHTERRWIYDKEDPSANHCAGALSGAVVPAFAGLPADIRA